MPNTENSINGQHPQLATETHQSYQKPALQRLSRWQVVTGSFPDCFEDPFNPACEVIE